MEDGAEIVANSLTVHSTHMRNWNWTESVSSWERGIDLKFRWRSWGKKRCLKESLKFKILYSL